MRTRRFARASLGLALVLATVSTASASDAPTSRVARTQVVVKFFDSPEAAIAARTAAGLLPALSTSDEPLDLSMSVWNPATGALNLDSPALDFEYDYFDPVSPGSLPSALDDLLPDSRKFLIGTVSGSSLVCPLRNSTFSDTWGAPRPNGRVHVGTDMIAPYGSPVLTVADSTVVRVDRVNEHIPGTDIDPGGLSVAYITAWGDVFYSGHFSSIPVEVQPGARLPAGSIMGYVGSSGNAISSVPHLHIQWHPGASVPQNPYQLLQDACR